MQVQINRSSRAKLSLPLGARSSCQSSARPLPGTLTTPELRRIVTEMLG